MMLATWMSAGCGGRSEAPQFHYVRLDGTPAHTNMWRGQVVLVSFWATTCMVCVREMPRIVATHERFKGRGLQTLAVAMRHDTPARVSRFTQTRQLPMEVVIDSDGAIARSFGDVQSTPTTFLIDRHGRIVKRYIGEPDFLDLQATIDSLIREG